MPISKCSRGLFLVLCVLVCGCGNLLRVSKFNSGNPQGVPFFVKHGICVQQTTYANPYWRLAIAYSPSEGQPFSGTLLISDTAHGATEFSSVLVALSQKPTPDSQSVMTAWQALEAKYTYDPWADLQGKRLLANGEYLTAEVDYGTVYAINERKPFSGSSQADFKLAADGTLNETSGQVQDNTFTTVASALPISSLITSAAGIVTPVGKSADEKKVLAQFTLKQEQRYIKIVYSKNTLASSGICNVGPPLKKDDQNVGLAVTDVGSTDTQETASQDKGTDSISISGTIKLPKSVQPAASVPNPGDGPKPANNAPTSTKDQSAGATQKNVKK